jgi:hypothetical protein
MSNLVKLFLSALVLTFLAGCGFGGDWGDDDEGGGGGGESGTMCAFANNEECFPKLNIPATKIKYGVFRQPVSENDRNAFFNALSSKGFYTYAGDYFRNNFYRGSTRITTAQAGYQNAIVGLGGSGYLIRMNIEYDQGNSGGWYYPDIYDEIFAPLPDSAKLIRSETRKDYDSDMTSQFIAYGNKLQNEHGFSPYTGSGWRKTEGGVIYYWYYAGGKIAIWEVHKQATL